ncbi:MAG: DUF3307 domain-containing protein [bacterium]
MELFWQLMLAHFLADFSLQSAALVYLKKENLWGILLHTSIFTFTSCAISWKILGIEWVVCGVPIYGWIFVGILSIFHFFVDWLKVVITNKHPKLDNLLLFVVDQFLHVVLIFGLFNYKDFFNFYEYKVWILLLIFIGLSHFLTIVIFYIEKDLKREKHLDREKKYILIADRLVVGLAFLITGTWWIVFIAGWMLNTFLMRLKHKVEYSYFELIVGYLAAILLGFCARIVYFN